MSSSARSTRAALRRQPPASVARRRASAARRAVSSSEEGGFSDASSSSEEEKQRLRAAKRLRRAAQTKTNEAREIESREPDEAKQIVHESEVIDAVCAATTAAISRSTPRPRVSPAAAAAKSAPRVRSGMNLSLCEVGERVMMSFLPVLPDRLKAESVCTRWRHMSTQEVAMTELDFDKVVLRSVTKKHIIQILQRAHGQLRRLVLPDMRLDDAIIRNVVCHTDLRMFRVHR